MQTTLKELKDDAMKSFKPRTPKKITDITTKLQMKRMVEDLESEIGKIRMDLWTLYELLMFFYYTIVYRRLFNINGVK